MKDEYLGDLAIVLQTSATKRYNKKLELTSRKNTILRAELEQVNKKSTLVRELHKFHKVLRFHEVTK